MFQILSYSGICTKTKAMSGKLIKPEQYEQLINCSHVSEALSFLKQLPAYETALKEYDEASSHRGIIEAALTDSLYQDYNRLYRFANPKQRDFLRLYFMHFEVTFLKACLRSAFAKSDTVLHFSSYRRFFGLHSDLNFDALIQCTSADAFVQALEGTRFYAALDRIRNSEFNTLFDFELCLDQFYFSFLWKEKDKVLHGNELKIITDNYGQKIDLLNIQWILRARRFYHMSTSEIYAMIVPCYYHLKPDQISAMVECSGADDLRAAIHRTYYGRKYSSQVEEIHSLEGMYTHLLEHIYDLAGRRNPYSIAPIYAYLYNKEHEINRITSLIEGIRYGLPKSELTSYIIQKKN